MTDDIARPAGADDDEKIWNDLKAAEEKAADPESAGKADDRPEQGAEPPPKGDDKTVEGKDAAEAAPQADDIWAKAPPELRAAHDAARSQTEQWKHKYQSDIGRIGAYQRRIDDLEKKLAEATKAPADSKAKAEPDPLDDEQWNSFATEYPELANGPIGAMRKRMLAAEAEVGRVKSELGGISSERRVDNLREQLTLVEQAHPDYVKIKGSADFLDWYNRAPAYIKAGIQRNAVDIVDGQEVAHILQLFKTDTGWGKPLNPAAPKDAASPKPPASDKRALQMESAATPRGKGPAKTAEGQPDPDDAEAWWKYYQEQDRRQAQRR